MPINVYRVLLLISVFALGFLGEARSQEEKPQIQYTKKNLIKINLMSPVLSSLSMSYERVLNTNTSFQMSFFVQDQRFSFSDETLKGFGFTPEVRIYLSERKQAPGGFFVAPFLSYRQYQHEYKYYDGFSIIERSGKADYQAYGVGVIVGAQWIFKKQFLLMFGVAQDLGLGALVMCNPIRTPIIFLVVFPIRKAVVF
ncbi:MAG: DUF3575 domain-containing protein [Microscillaceae bacterium]|nr:DUF3575 domain-containing protein [Microscillaceae bacterium]